MNSKQSTLAVFLYLLALLSFSCGGVATPTPDKTLADKPTSGKPDASPAGDTPTASTGGSQAAIAGDYTVTGSNVDGKGQYTGDLRITQRDSVYQFSWVSGGKSSDGVGVLAGDKVAVAFTDGKNGSGCGVVLYKILPNGDLDGKAGYWGVNSAESETAKRTSGNDLDAEYDISGKNTDGKEYRGTLKVAKDGEGYTFVWDTGSIAKGFGIRQGTTVSVGIGGPQCSFVSYEIKPDGTLEGKWGGQSSKKFGSETATKKK
ncbi:MAG: hypothetical protein KF756_00695 [Acidobacteria bacterium]|nr:hypothetical protein [Acidobacteriota bacterium]